MKKGTSSSILNFILTIVLICVIPCSNTDDEQNVSILSNSSVKNISDVRTDLNDDKVSITDPIIEPSLEENVNVAIDSDNVGVVKNPDTETEKSELPNSVSINDAPVLFTTESSPIELDHLSDISLVITSQKEEIPTQKVSETSQKVPEPNVNIPLNITANESDSDDSKTAEESAVKVEEVAQKNDSETKTEDIPSFSEWAQKRLEEVEKNEQINSSVKGQTERSNGKTQNAKLRWKNYASLDCGAKVVAANPEAVSPSAILSPSSDEYKLNPCTARIWFVVELCEAIQAKKIDLANYELFSSSPKEFTVSVSERFPTRDWALIGKFTADDERDIQSFDLDTELFGKYIKVEVKSHYGSEHYCPISLFRAYGASVFEVLQKEDAANVNRPDDDDDDDDDYEQDTEGQENTDKKNIFSSATDAVMSVVKRAAQILGTKSNDDAQNTKNSTVSTLISTCSSPRHLVSCDKCSETLFGQIYELLSCNTEEIKRIVSIPTIFRTLKSSSICEKYGYHFRNSSKRTSLISNIGAFFPEKYVGAMCNEVAIMENNGVVNVSQHFSNITKNLSNEKIVHMDVDDAAKDQPQVIGATTPSVISQNQTDSNVSTQEIAQIKPTKTLTVNVNFTQTNTEGETSDKVVPVEISTEAPEPGAIMPEASTETTFSGEGDVSTDGTDVLDDQLSHIMVDLNAGEGQNPVITSTATSGPQAAKESIFLRLFNRIKSLERNMSISSQYLEELSKRYKKQVEEMREETLKRDELNKQLEERLDKLTSTIENMAAERRTFLSVVYCLLFFGICSVGLYFFCGRCTERARRRSPLPPIARRQSLDELRPKKTERKRRPSDQAMRIAWRDSEDAQAHKKRKRKRPVHNRSISLGNIKIGKERWPCERQTVVEEVTVVLDESDNSILEGCRLSNEVNGDDEIKSKSSQDRDERDMGLIENVALRNVVGETAVKKEKKGFKRLLKKVF